MTRAIELANLRKATVGTAGSVRLAGEGVMPRHAEITVYESAAEVITAVRPLDGPIAVARRGRMLRVTAPWPLADGDVIVVGPHRLTYRDLGSPMAATSGEARAQEVVSWLL